MREISVQLNIRECFFRTRIARITRILQVGGTCFIKDKILLDFILHFLSSRKRSRLQIRLKSICIENKGQKNPCQRLRVHLCDP